MEVPEQAYRPRHVAIIMDGNGRWALDHGLERLEGHRRGADVAREITTLARELQLEHLTLYSFSRQNWQRPSEEVAGLMLLLEHYCVTEVDTLMKHNIRLSTLGEVRRLPNSTRQALFELVQHTRHNTGMILSLALDYGGREEIVHAVRQLAHDIKANVLRPEHIDEASIATRLYTGMMPDPDLLIRTSGEMRISNFLLWQLAYAELHFCPVRWPDFTRCHFIAALQDYAQRQRRFGATSEAAGSSSSDCGVTYAAELERKSLRRCAPDLMPLPKI